MTRSDWMTPHPARLSPDHPRYAEIMRCHDRSVEAGRPGYADPATGFFVFTAAVHRDRGACCGNGCRHCPYIEDE